MSCVGNNNNDGDVEGTANGLSKSAIVSDDGGSNNDNKSSDGGDNVGEPLKPIVVCGPSGVGKSTLIKMIRKHFHQDEDEDDNDDHNPFEFPVKHTTRPPKKGEVDGIHYHFTNEETFKNDMREEQFIEHTHVQDNYYGTSIESIRNLQKKTSPCTKIGILDLDIQGHKQMKKCSSIIDAHYIFISPPSLEELEKRVRKSISKQKLKHSELAVKVRLANASSEMEYSTDKDSNNRDYHFDCIFINDDVQTTLEEMIVELLGWYPHLYEQQSQSSQQIYKKVTRGGKISSSRTMIDIYKVSEKQLIKLLKKYSTRLTRENMLKILKERRMRAKEGNKKKKSNDTSAATFEDQFLLNTNISHSGQFYNDSNSGQFTTIAMQLLTLSNQLSQLRYVCVPSRMKDPMFWDIIFFILHLSTTSTPPTTVEVK